MNKAKKMGYELVVSHYTWSNNYNMEYFAITNII